MININRDSDQKLKGKKVPKGVALLIVLATMLSLSIIIGVILILARGRYHVAASHIKRTKAFYLAEGGIQHALWAIRTGNLNPIPTPGTSTPIYLDVDNDLGTERPEAGIGEETWVRITDHPGGTLPDGVLYDIEAKVDTDDIPAK